MTFCTISPTDISKAFLVGPNTIDFLAQNPSFEITKGQNFFVNIFFDSASTTSCTGERLTEFSPVAATPLPAALPLLATGLGGVMGLLGWRRKRKHSAAIAVA
jgi:hypothetical protein